MIRKIEIFILAFGFATQVTIAQSTFQKTYGGGANDYCTSVRQTTDGGYILAGSTWSFGAGSEYIYIIKTNPAGDTLWTRITGNYFGAGGIEAIRQTFDGGYIVGSGNFNGSTFNKDLLLYKYDQDGNLVWGNNYGDGGTKQEAGQSVLQTPDSGFVCCGSISNFGASSQSDVYMVRTGKNGNVLWAKSYGGSSFDYGKSVQPTSDGGFIICGYTNSFGAGSSDIYLVKTTGTGDTLWTRSYGGAGQEIGYLAIQTPGGGYMVVGSTTSFGAGDEDALVFLTDATGNPVWAKTYGGALADYGTSVQTTDDGNYIICGVTQSFGGGKTDGYLIKINSTGDTLWTKAYGGSENDYTYDVCQTQDGGFAIGAYSLSYGAGSEDIYLIKTDPSGNAGCCNQFSTNTVIASLPLVARVAHTQVSSPQCFATTAQVYMGNGGVTGDVRITPGVAVTASANPFCNGSSVDFTAMPVCGGPAPVYKWMVNHQIVATGQPVFTYSPANGDTVWCSMKTGLPCAYPDSALSGKIVMTGYSPPIVSLASCFDTITTVTARAIKLKGGNPLGGWYSGPGVNSATGVLTPSTAGSGSKTVSYTYTNVALCSAVATRSILILPDPSFNCGSLLTDIRDNMTYPTIQIGSQCWMAANLNHGITLSSMEIQTDNCIHEKYCYHDLGANCAVYGALYLWDELMQYSTNEGFQGLCPPGWHLPDENEWMTLVNFYDGNGRAGKPMQDSVMAGFRALPGGVLYMNNSWNFNGFAALFWSSAGFGQYQAISHGLNTHDFSVSLYLPSRVNAFPARCLMN